jgi:predicted enzyme related to lactoylglutathione lyase
MYRSANLTVMVSDMQRAIDFYTSVLGLELKVRYGDFWAEVTTPGMTLGLHPARGAIDRGACDGLSVGFEVEDIQAAVAALAAKGVALTAPVRETDELWQASFVDPDGTPLYFAQSKYR